MVTWHTVCLGHGTRVVVNTVLQRNVFRNLILRGAAPDSIDRGSFPAAVGDTVPTVRHEGASLARIDRLIRGATPERVLGGASPVNTHGNAVPTDWGRGATPAHLDKRTACSSRNTTGGATPGDKHGGATPGHDPEGATLGS